MQMIRILMCALAFLVTTLSVAQGGSESEIDILLHKMFDKPGTTLTIKPIVVVGSHAVASWTQGDMGGRALLRRKGGEWSIVLCSGDALKSADTLVRAAVPQADAEQLEKRLAKAEASLDPKVITQFSRFEGLVMMDDAGHHPLQHK